MGCRLQSLARHVQLFCAQVGSDRAICCCSSYNWRAIASFSSSVRDGGGVTSARGYLHAETPPLLQNTFGYGRIEAAALAALLQIFLRSGEFEAVQPAELLQNNELCQAVSVVVPCELHRLAQLDTRELRKARASTWIGRDSVDHVWVDDRHVTGRAGELRELRALADHVRSNVALDRVGVKPLRVPCEQASGDANRVDNNLRAAGARCYVTVKEHQQQPLLWRVQEVL